MRGSDGGVLLPVPLGGGAGLLRLSPGSYSYLGCLFWFHHRTIQPDLNERHRKGYEFVNARSIRTQTTTGIQKELGVSESRLVV